MLGRKVAFGVLGVLCSMCAALALVFGLAGAYAWWLEIARGPTPYAKDQMMAPLFLLLAFLLARAAWSSFRRVRRQ